MQDTADAIATGAADPTAALMDRCLGIGSWTIGADRAEGTTDPVAWV